MAGGINYLLASMDIIRRSQSGELPTVASSVNWSRGDVVVVHSQGPLEEFIEVEVESTLWHSLYQVGPHTLVEAFHALLLHHPPDDFSSSAILRLGAAHDKLVLLDTCSHC